VAAYALVLGVLAAIATGCEVEAGDAPGDAPGGLPATPTSAAPTTSTTIDRDFAVGQRTVELVDTSRPTAAAPNRNIAASDERRIRVVLLYPAAGDVAGDTTATEDAPVAEGRFPLVVFSHGVTATGEVYIGRIAQWAEAGYIVAAPTFPLSSGPGANIGDYVNQPDDVRFVIDSLVEGERADGEDPVREHIDAERIGVAGHSLGAVTTIGVAYNSCCADERIDAAVEVSGIEVPFRGGNYSRRPDTPLLAVHGAADAVVPVRGSERLFAQASGPAYFLRFPQGNHTDVLFGARGQLVDDVVIAFFDRYLYGSEGALDGVAELVERSGDATFEARGA
jgi:predicted dienelactone hydrolase